MKVPSPSLFPGCTLWLTIAGALCGIVSAFYLNMADPVEYEGTAVVRPVRHPGGASGASHREWLNTEVTAMESQENLQRVARNLNLEAELKKSRDECVQTLKGMVKVEAIPDSALVRVTVRSSKAPESAEVANAVVTARTDFHKEAFAHRQIDRYLNNNGERIDLAKRRGVSECSRNGETASGKGHRYRIDESAPSGTANEAEGRLDRGKFPPGGNEKTRPGEPSPLRRNP